MLCSCLELSANLSREWSIYSYLVVLQDQEEDVDDEEQDAGIQDDLVLDKDEL